MALVIASNNEASNPSSVIVKYTSEEIGVAKDPLTDPVDSVSPFFAEYFLVCSAESRELNHGTWSFSLDSIDGQVALEAHDTEVGDLNRLTLLAAVRGLEAIDGASDVTLLSQNRYLIRSLTDSLPRWRANQFAWEHFGRRMDVQNADLWRRIDHTLSIHRVEACLVSSRLVSRQGTSLTGTPDLVDSDHFGSDSSSGMEARGSNHLLGNNLGGIQWRVDESHSKVRQPASRSLGQSKDRLGLDRVRQLIGDQHRPQSKTDSLMESA